MAYPHTSPANYRNSHREWARASYLDAGIVRIAGRSLSAGGFMPIAHIHFMYDLVEGDLREAKRRLADEVADSIARNVVHHHQGSPKDLVTVVFHDIGADDWAVGGTLFRDRAD